MSLYALDDFQDTTPPTSDRSGSGWVLREVDTPARYVGHRCAEQVGPLVSCKRKQKARDIGRDICGRGFAHAIGPVAGDELLDTCTAKDAHGLARWRAEFAVTGPTILRVTIKNPDGSESSRAFDRAKSARVAALLEVLGYRFTSWRDMVREVRS